MTAEELELFKSFRTKIDEIVEEERFRLGGLPRRRLEQLVSQLIREKLVSDHGIFTVYNLLHACFSRAVALHCFGFAENCIHELVLQSETLLKLVVCESIHMDEATREDISLGKLVARSPKATPTLAPSRSHKQGRP